MTPEEEEAQRVNAKWEADRLVKVQDELRKHKLSMEHTTEEYIAAMVGSFGIKKTIFTRLGITRGGLDARIKNDPEVAAAYAAERAQWRDKGESLLARNLELIEAAQKPVIKDGVETQPYPVDLTDVKWLLQRVAKEDWGNSVAVTGPDGGALDAVHWTPEQWKARQAAKAKENAEAELLLAEPVDYNT